MRIAARARAATRKRGELCEQAVASSQTVRHRFGSCNVRAQAVGGSKPYIMSRGGGRREAFDVYCWGHGGQGALGNSAFRDELEPYLVSSLRAHGGSMCAIAKKKTLRHQVTARTPHALVVRVAAWWIAALITPW